MIADEIRKLLLSVADAAVAGHTLFPARPAAALAKWLAGLSPQSEKVIAALVGLPGREFAEARDRVVAALGAARRVFTTDQWADVVSFCRWLAGRPVLLRAIALQTRLSGGEPGGGPAERAAVDALFPSSHPPGCDPEQLLS